MTATSNKVIKTLQEIPRAVYVTAASAWGGRLIVAMGQLISIPLLLQYLGIDQYSWLVVALSLQGWWLLTDMGLALSLQNEISASRANKQNDGDLIVSAAALVLPLLLVSTLLILIFADSLASLLLPSEAVRSGQGGLLMAITGILGLLLAAGNVAYRILYARHKGYWVSILPALGTVMSLAGLVALQYFRVAESLLWAAVVWSGPSALLAAIAFGVFVIKAFRLSNGVVRPFLCRKLIKQGSQFGLFAVLAALTLQIDYVVIGKLMTEQDILLYNISTKMMAFVSFFFSAVVQAVWPVCSEAAALQKWSQVDVLMRRLLALGACVITLGAGSMWLFHQEVLLHIAPQQHLVIPGSFWVLLTIYAWVRVWSDSFAMLLQSMNRVRIFLSYVPIQSAICVVGQIVLGGYFGLNGLVIGMIASFVLTSVWILPRSYYDIKHSSS